MALLVEVEVEVEVVVSSRRETEIRTNLTNHYMYTVPLESAYDNVPAGRLLIERDWPC